MRKILFFHPSTPGVNIVDLYEMNADGTGIVNLTNDPLNNDATGSYSFDGSKILFSSDRTGYGDVYSMNTDGSGLTRLTFDPISSREPAMSPNGTKIAFSRGSSGTASPFCDIYLMDADGSNQVPLTHSYLTATATPCCPGASVNSSPSWSPDGSKIAFTSNRMGEEQIFVMDADGSNPTNLSSNAFGEWAPSWSHDGTKILFSSNADGDWELFTMAPNGSNRVQLTFDRRFYVYHCWSPDDTRIAVSCMDGSGTIEVFVMDADGSNKTQLTFPPGQAVVQNRAWR